MKYWYQVKKVGVVPAHSIESSVGQAQAVRQLDVVFTDVLIVGGLDVDGQSCTPIGLHKSDAASDWLLIKGQSCTPIGLHKSDAASDWLLIKQYRWYESLAGSLVTKLNGLNKLSE